MGRWLRGELASPNVFCAAVGSTDFGYLVGWDEKEFRRDENAFEMAQVTQFVFDSREPKFSEQIVHTYLPAPEPEHGCSPS